MRLRVIRCVSSGLFVAMGMGIAAARPADSKLLSLVPPGAQIVSGFENKPNKAGGPFLMTTVNNAYDLEDWCALAGVDPGRTVAEVVEATLAPAGTVLNEHLILVAGVFHRDRIYQAAELNGAKLSDYLGVPVLIIEPFSRERDVMKDTRWLLILDDRVVVFGTPLMVQQAFARIQNHAAPDPAMMQRLGLLHRDVSSWSIFTSMPMLHQNVFVRTGGPFSQLFQGTDVMMVGVEFDKKVRVDIFVQADQGTRNFDTKAKANQIGEVFNRENADEERHRPQLKIVQQGGDRVQAWIALSNDQFRLWRAGQSSRDQATIDEALARSRSDNNRAMSAPDR